MKNKTLLLVDGYGFVFRAYHSLPPLTSPDGTPVGAVYGYTNMLIKLLEKQQADYIAIILDAGQKTFRNDIYAEYKANRPPAPEDLKPQFPIVREASESLNISTLSKVGYEADDLIATYTHMAVEEGMKVRIVSSDKDLMQLVGDSVQMLDPMKMKVIGTNEVTDKFGVPPEKLLDVLSLMGDSADNVPGVPGIGPKTAAELIGIYDNLETLLDNAHEIKQPKRRQSLIDFREQALLSKELITLDHKVTLDTKLEDMLKKTIESEQMYTFAAKYGFKSIAAKFQGDQSSQSSTNQSQVIKIKPVQKEITTSDQLDEWLSSLNDLSSLTVCLNTLNNSIAISTQDLEHAILNIDHEEPAQTGFFEEELTQKDSKIMWFDTLKKWLLKDHIKVVCYPYKECLNLFNLDDNYHHIHDLQSIAYLVLGGKNDNFLDVLNERYFSKLTDLHGISLKKASDKEQNDHFCALSYTIASIVPLLFNDLYNQKLNSLYWRLDKPIIHPVRSMEKNGIAVNAQLLQNLSHEFRQEITSLEKEVFKITQEEFNIASPKQLGEILFDKLELPGGKKSKKTGAYSTNAEILEDLAHQGYEIASILLKWRQLTKLQSTYTDALTKQISNEGRIHSSFTLYSTSTGRLSSVNPNLQNIPVRSQEGNKIREAFVAPKGYKLISADYSQIELRLLSHIANIESLKSAFANDHDIHAATASQMFNVPINEADGELRRKAKVINFGIIYGISAFGLAQRLGISRKEASEYIEHYFKQYPGIKNYMDLTVSEAQKNGFVSTLLGRKIITKNINSKNPSLRQFSERAAINAPIQGSAADLIKLAMIRLQEHLDNYQDAKLVLQVHDELIIQCKESDAKHLAQLLVSTMENAQHLSIPLRVDAKIGNNWSEIH